MDNIWIGVGLGWEISQNRPNKCTIEVSKILGKIPAQHLPQTNWLHVLMQHFSKIAKKNEK